ncbi:YrdB family protein [Intrasporangium sp. YIM S08009]|uniref:YrdB family protein n=1 Tax=Intrasporangium zincisolvens TaxID=3080018 RepID=UPI002B053E16|nr:YrdB family protein [Intrasporangium sp. YIM S08009]
MSTRRVGGASGEGSSVPPTPTGPWLLVGAGRFAAELGMLAALGVGGWTAGARAGAAVGVVVAVALPVLAAVVWGRWVAPRAGHRLEDPARLGVEVVLFAAAAGGLVRAGHPGWALALALLWAATAPFGRRSMPS